MVEFAVYVIKACLERQWANLMQLDLDQWRECFSASIRVGKVIDDAYAVFKTNNTQVPVFMAWNPRLFTRGEHLIAVSLAGQETEGQFLHNANVGQMLAGNLPTFATQESVELAAWVVSPQPELVMFLHAFVRRAILTDNDWLIAECGFDTVLAVGAMDVQAPSELTPDGIPAIYGRRVKVKGAAIDEATGFTRPTQREAPPAILVHDTETSVDAIVNRTTRTETPIEARFGRVEVDDL